MGQAIVSPDPRWPALAAALHALSENKRHAVRIVDADCGNGRLLLDAVCHARALGFTSIEGRGIDGVPALIGRARAAANRLQDPAIGVVFEVADMAAALDDEQELPADILIWHSAAGNRADVPEALRRAGERLIGDADVAAAA